MSEGSRPAGIVDSPGAGARSVLNRSEFLVSERAGPLRADYAFDICDPDTGAVLLECREDRVGRLSRIFRFTSLKRTTPFDLVVRVPGGAPILRVARGVPVVFSRVSVYDEDDELIGVFRQKVFSIGGAFDVLDATGTPLCRLKGGMTGRSFRFVAAGNVELGSVSSRWAGLGKELLTSADDHVLRIDEAVPPGGSVRCLLLASAICIGMVQKIEIP